MIKVQREGVILEPTENSFENLSVLNPAVYQDGKEVHLIYRAINKNHISSFGYARLNGPFKVEERWRKPFLKPQYSYEKKGIEDPRIVKINGTFYMTYVVHDGKNALIAYAYGTDLFKLKRGGIISPNMPYVKASKLFKYSKLKDDYYFFESFYKNYGGKNIKVWNKDGFLFPEKIKDKFVLAHRILPDIQLVRFTNFKQLKELCKNEPDNPRNSLLFHSRIAYTLTHFVLLLLGIPLVIGFERLSRNLFLRVGLCVLVCGIFYSLSFICSNLGNTGMIYPILAAWLPIVILGSVGLLFFDMMKM